MANLGSERTFTRATKRQCWEAAATVDGRSPDRWRLDAVGNVVAVRLTNCEGPLCYEFDHIVPWSRGGASEFSNCQILSTRVNRLKGAQEGLDRAKLSSYAPAKTWAEGELDVVELAVWGNIDRPGLRCRIPSLLEQFKGTFKRLIGNVETTLLPRRRLPSCPQSLLQHDIIQNHNNH